MPATSAVPWPHARPGRARPHECRRARCSPAPLRIGALQVLHLGENVAEVLAVLAAFAMPRMGTVLRTLERRFGEYRVEPREPRGAYVPQPPRHAAIGQRAVQLILGEQLHRVRPERIEGRLHTRVTF